MHCRDAAHLLERYALLLELAGENPFKARAFSRAAELLAPLDMALEHAVALEAIQQAPGIGEGIRGVLAELAKTGTIGHLETLERAIPAGVVQLTELRGIGAKRARQLWQDCGITSIEELERACRDGRIARCKGFTAKSQASLLEAIAFWRSTRGRLQRHKCWRLFDELRSFLLDHGAQEVYPAGELRRGTEVVSSLAIVAIADSPGVLPLPPDFIPSGARSYRSLERDIVVEIVLATPDETGTALFSATGSQAFIHAVAGSANLPLFPTEAEVFAHFGLPYVPPELRDDATLPERLRHGESIPPLVTMEHCAACCTSTPTGATASIRSKKWHKLQQRWDSSTSPSATTARALPTLEVSASNVSPSNVPLSRRSTSVDLASAFCTASKAIFSQTAR
ncbi:MAG: hypothetical protein KatS3mg038_0155 [Candidatus Kapaibacterium sp.]|nr:MAG: hypothetical protein KatS3mg038_0155 [Candidatus Kapabacteria bacterium]